jgi:hypothetical protein
VGEEFRVEYAKAVVGQTAEEERTWGAARLPVFLGLKPQQLAISS